MKHIPASKVRSSLGKHILTDGFDLVLDIRKSKGCKIYDSAGDREFLDFFSFFASAPLGMNHPKLNNDEFIKYLGEVAINKPANSDFYSEELAQFVEVFADVVIPDSHPHLFFISGGALAVENALKAAFDWKVRKNIAAGRSKIGSKVIHFRKAFHGRTGYTLSLTNTADPRKYMYYPLFDWPRVDPPSVIFPVEDNLDAIIDAESKSLAQIDAAIAKHGHDIACMIIEPIQGEGGDNHFRPEYLQKLRALADTHEFLLIFDEVQSGMGFTGNWWAWQTLGVEPDIFCFGKKSQVCGIACNTRIDEVDDNVFHESSRINSTWGGNLVDMVRCAKYIDVIIEDDILDNVRKRGKTLMSELHNLMIKYPDIVSNVRGMGLMCAFDVPTAAMRNEILSSAYAKGAIVLPCGESSIRFRPPMIITDAEIREVSTILDSALGELSG